MSCKLLIIWVNYEENKNGSFFNETPCVYNFIRQDAGSKQTKENPRKYKKKINNLTKKQN